MAETPCMNWIDSNMSMAVGQFDDEFGELVDVLDKEFFKGLTEAVKRFGEAARTVMRTEDFLCIESCLAWRVHNILAFMREAMDANKSGGLAVKCTVADLCADMEQQLAMLPLDDAVVIACAGGAIFLSEPGVIAEIRNGTSTAWLSKHMRWARDGMSDDVSPKWSVAKAVQYFAEKRIVPLTFRTTQTRISVEEKRLASK